MPWSERKSNSPHVEIVAQGRLLTVKAVGLELDMPHGRGRGNVEEFTKQSRLRLLRKLARISPPEVDGFRHRCTFITLTARKFFHPRQFKDFMRAFFKRLGRKAPRLACVWRLDYQKRGAPHCHLIVYNCPFIDKEHIQEIWGDIIGQEKPFTRIESIRSYKHLVNYAARYAAKVSNGGFNIVTYQAVGENVAEYVRKSPGRVWGVFNDICLPYAEITSVKVPLDGSWWMLRRYCLKFYPWVWENSEGGFTVFTDDPYHAAKHMKEMSAYFCNAKI